MFKVELLNPDVLMCNNNNSIAYRSAQQAAASCYQPNFDKIVQAASKIDVEKLLFLTGHHTTMQHADHFLSFHLSNIPISLITFGLHMTHSFYNTSQCSGRYCTDIFNKTRIVFDVFVNEFIAKYCSDIRSNSFQFNKLNKWLNSGIEFYKSNIAQIEQFAEEAIRNERPFYKGNISLQAKRIAQDQLRVILSTITPTHLIHTLNIISLLSLYEVAWNHPLQSLTYQMIDESLNKSDFINMYHKLISSDFKEFTPDFEIESNTNLIFDPIVYVDKDVVRSKAVDKLIDLYNSDSNTRVLNTMMFNPRINPIDSDSNSTIKMTVNVPVLTFGQDQRHRTISRSNPTITNKFYVPPLLSNFPNIVDFCQQHYEDYCELAQYSKRDMIHFIPYGAVVRYVKEADIRAYLHSLNKRLCWNAESAICKMERETIRQMCELGNDDKLPFNPPCIDSKCHEGSRFCGRNLISNLDRNYL